jgi:hypothetical protein
MPAEKFGAHIGAIHRWIQWNAIRGDQVAWGSNEPLVLKRNVSPALLEDVAQEVADAVIDDSSLITSKKLQSSWDDIGNTPFTLTVDGEYSVKLKIDGKDEEEYLNLGDALSSLFYHHFKR